MPDCPSIRSRRSWGNHPCGTRRSRAVEYPHHDQAIDEKFEDLRVEQGAHDHEEAREDDQGDVAGAAQFVKFDPSKPAVKAVPASRPSTVPNCRI